MRNRLTLTLPLQVAEGMFRHSLPMFAPTRRNENHEN